VLFRIPESSCGVGWPSSRRSPRYYSAGDHSHLVDDVRDKEFGQDHGEGGRISPVRAAGFLDRNPGSQGTSTGGLRTEHSPAPCPEWRSSPRYVTHSSSYWTEDIRGGLSPDTRTLHSEYDTVSWFPFVLRCSLAGEVRRQLGAPAWLEAYESGRALAPDHAMRLAGEQSSELSSHLGVSSARLSLHETEVLRLVAAGFT
jgi:hypothetical protein